MAVEVRKRTKGEVYYSIVFWDGEKRVRLKKDSHPNFKTLQEAQEWDRANEAIRDSAKTRILRRLQWKTQYYKFAELSEQYIENCKKTQPNSWKNTQFYLEHYVMPFYLEVKKSNNPNNWSMHFEEFRDWLEDDAMTVTSPKRSIAYSTKNHVIKTLNTFLDYLLRRNLLDKSNVYKMTGFPASKINMRSADALISKEEFNAIYGILLDTNPLVATFFQTAYYTGMRFNEIYGLSMDDIFSGELDDKVLKTALSDHDMDYFGYIVLESQPAFKIRNRLSNGSIPRKPLKGKPIINEKYNRLIPIIDKDCFNALVKLYKIQEAKFKQKQYGSNLKDYVLFEDLTSTMAAVELRMAYEKTKFSQKSYHCCRHTRCTELVGNTRDFVLAKYWLGHARQETTMRYTHIYQQSARTAKKKRQKIELLE